MIDNKKGVIVIGIVIVVDVKGVIVNLVEEVDGYICVVDFVVECVEDVIEVVSVGDSIEVKFMGVDCKNCIVNLFVKVKD